MAMLLTSELAERKCSPDRRMPCVKTFYTDCIVRLGEKEKQHNKKCVGKNEMKKKNNTKQNSD